ncbi:MULTISPECIES: ABC transporter ATP-binding protein [Staphylococcus]|uniref:ABC transporter, ATP-binding protein n=3 Tax=Bacilli TaxID=91061 RepID=A0A0M2NTB6_STACC|nr:MULTISPECIES: ABC transporter ATP-binding protein [Staphylococcus]KKI62966.1 ABC transporter, ATP-binding protein [Staphylococcus cohnii subsp. cohnii]MBL0376455.1 ABC transporter ATP-binding protein [Staphylococcus sp. S75]MBL0383048.1 ABC transporter ATP-binding protein [Staphylococcus sp. S59]MBL0401617.1 ABC transporter ATP-binding protein [Staphylococcus sp. S36]MCT1915578.1 ABC transporter ATP-binding protein [Staphylococcus ureilyticus]
MYDILKVENLKKTFDKSDFALDNVSFVIKKNSIVGFVGKNGAGKSTTINTILNALKKDTGQITFFDKHINNKNEYFRENIGVVFDDAKLPENLNVTQLNHVLNNIYSTWNIQDYYKYIEFFQLPKKTKIKNFSKGMRMKISITVALSHASKLLILDEATSGLDIESRQKLLDVIKNFAKQEDCGVLMSSHIIEDISNICNEVLFIDNGKIILNESKSNLIENYSILIVHSEDEIKNVPVKSIVKKTQVENHIALLLNKKVNKQYESRNNKQVTLEEVSKILVGGSS